MNAAASSDEIALFVRVVDLGSFAAVAADRGLSPSGVSKAISRLEDRLGVRLLQRTTRRLALTPEGETLLLRGREILAAIAAAEAEVTEGRGKPRGLLRVNSSSAFVRHRLVPRLTWFTARYPEITVEVSVSDRRIDPVAEQMDIVIRTGPLEDSLLVARRLGVARRVICASPAYLARAGRPCCPADLERHDCLVLTTSVGLAAWPMRRGATVETVRVNGRVKCDSADTLRDMALAGLGIVRLGDFMLEDAIADGRLVPLLEEHHAAEPFPITALMPAGRQSLPRVRAFLDFLVGCCGQSPVMQRPALVTAPPAGAGSVGSDAPRS